MAPQLVRGLFSGCRLDMSGISEEEEGEGRKEGVRVCNEKNPLSQHELSDVGIPCCRGTCQIVMRVVKNSNNVVSKQAIWGW